MPNLPFYFRFFLLFTFLTMTKTIIAQKKDNPSLSLKIREANSYLYSNPQKAIEISREVYQKTKDDDIKITALAVVINGYSSTNQIRKALEYSEKAIQIANKSNSITHQIWALGLMGEQYQVAGQNNISRELLNRAKSLIASADFSEESKALALGNIYAIVGNGYKDEIDCKYAVQNYDMAIDAYQPYVHNSAAKNNLALVYLEKGDCLLELNSLDQAKKYFNDAIRISKESELQEYLRRGKTRLVKVESEMGNYETSSLLAEKLLNESSPELPVELKNSLFRTLSFNSLKQGNLKHFQKYEKKFLETSKEIKSIKNSVYDQVLDFMETDSSNSKNINFTFLYGILIPVLGMGVFEFFFRKKKHKNH